MPTDAQRLALLTAIDAELMSIAHLERARTSVAQRAPLALALLLGVAVLMVGAGVVTLGQIRPALWVLLACGAGIPIADLLLRMRVHDHVEVLEQLRAQGARRHRRARATTAGV